MTNTSSCCGRSSFALRCAAASVLVAAATPVVAQTGRSVVLGTPPALGVTSSYTAIYPPAAAGRLGAYGMTTPFSGAVPLSLPGWTSSGLLRIDVGNILVEGLFMLDSSGSFGWSVAIPTSAAWMGFLFDVQTLDIDVAANDVALGDNDLALRIGPGAIPSGLDMVPIPAGTFLMGSANTSFNYPEETPVHAVTISQPFWISRFEVTQGQFASVWGTNPAYFQWLGLESPVEIIRWSDAMAFCAALTAQEAAVGRIPAGYQYRLPTEAEWEYCARGGTTTEWAFGTLMYCQLADFANCVGYPQHAGMYAANPFGLHDMHGNIAEWCLDAWDGSSNYPASAVVDPYVTTGPDRVVRGGSWISSSRGIRSAARAHFQPGLAFNFLGFRVVLGPILVP